VAVFDIEKVAGHWQSPSLASSPEQQCSGHATHLAAFDIRPLPPHSLQGGGYILRPGCTGCLTARNPMPLLLGHLCSVANALAARARYQTRMAEDHEGTFSQRLEIGRASSLGIWLGLEPVQGEPVLPTTSHMHERRLSSRGLRSRE